MRRKPQEEKVKTDHRISMLPFLACLAVVLAWFSPWWIGGKNLAPLDLQNRMMSPWRHGNEAGYAKNHIVSDGVDQYLVYRMIAARNYREEGGVGWSSLTYGGTAQYANTMALYGDWTMQLHRWLEFWTAWHLGLMGQVLLAAWGMLAFLRGRNISDLWACCGALAYAGNSQFVTWIYHRWALGAFCWVPWILWSIDSHRRGSRFSRTMVPAFIAMAFLGGTLQHGALVALAVAAMWGEEMVIAGYRPGKQLRLAFRYFAWGILGTGLAAMMLLPCTDAFLTSNRLGLHMGTYGNAQNGIYPEGWLQPLFNLAAYPLQVFPSILGRCDSVDVLKLFKSELFYVAYFGSLPVLLAFLSLWRRDTPVIARLLVGCGLLLPLTPLVRYLYQRLFLLFILGGVFAFVHFMQTASAKTRLRLFRITTFLAGVGTFGWMTASIALQFKPAVLEKLKDHIAKAGSGSSFGFFTDWMAGRADHFVSDLFIWSPQQAYPLLLFAASLAGLYWTASQSSLSRTAGAWIVSLAVICEVSLVGSRWTVWTDPVRDPLFPPTPESSILRERVGHEGRVTTLIHPSFHMATTPFIPNTLAAYGIATISGYDSIVPDGMMLPNESPGNAGRLGRFGVTHLITWPGNPDVSDEWKPVWHSPMMALYENSLSIPRYAGFATSADKDAFFSGNPQRITRLNESSGRENTRLVEIPAGIRWIRIAENQDKGWEYRASPQSNWIPVQRAPDASMLFEVHDLAQTSHIEMRYAPPLWRTGMIISIVTMAALIASHIAMHVIRKNRDNPPRVPA